MSKFLYLPASEKCLLSAACTLVLLIRIGLWFLPFRYLQKALSRFAVPARGDKAEDASTVLKIVRFVRFAGGCVPSASCLTQALAALVLIRLCGQEAELKFGISIDSNKKFAAHAWLEKGGRIILGKLSDHRKYTTLKPSNYAA